MHRRTRAIWQPSPGMHELPIYDDQLGVGRLGVIQRAAHGQINGCGMASCSVRPMRSMPGLHRPSGYPLDFAYRLAISGPVQVAEQWTWGVGELGPVGIGIGLTLAMVLTRFGWLGAASILAQPYIIDNYLLMGMLDRDGSERRSRLDWRHQGWRMSSMMVAPGPSNTTLCCWEREARSARQQSDGLNGPASRCLGR